MKLHKNHKIIGTTEVVSLPGAGILNVPAKIDTGAYRCSIWASDIVATKHGISFKLFDKNSPYYTGQTVEIKKYDKVNVRNSFGHEEQRYRINLEIIVGDNTYSADFTLANRSINKYPMLLGRSLLKNRFVVDVTKKNVHFQLAEAKLVGEL
jgi:hypothetical protein